jgi:protein SCO1/2
MRLRFLLVLLLFAPACAVAAPPLDLSEFAYEQKLGNRLPVHLAFREENGRELRLADLLVGKPLILALGYFHCPNLCGVARADLFDALGKSGMVAGRDYGVIVLSIDPAETSADAKAAKAEDLSRYSLPGAQEGAHFLTGSAQDIEALAGAVGFRNRFDPELKQFIHPAGIVFATPTGVVSSYLLGVGYDPTDVRLGVTRAGLGSLAPLAMPVLLLCYHYDAQTGRYTPAVMNIMRLGASVTFAAVAAGLLVAFRRERRRA